MHHHLKKKNRVAKSTPLTRAIRSGVAVVSVIAFAILRPAHATELDVNALIVGSQTAAAPVAADCFKDDERLPKLADFMAGLAGQTKPAPLKLKGDTFAKLKPEVVALLKGNYEVLKPDCTTIPTANGLPSEKIELDFVDLGNSVVEAVGQGDDATLQYIRKSFRAAPIKAADAGPIFGAAPLNSEPALKLSKAWKLSTMSPSGDSHGCYGILNAQIFQALGGKITEGKTVNARLDDAIKNVAVDGTACSLHDSLDVNPAKQQVASALGVTLKRIPQ